MATVQIFHERINTLRTFKDKITCDLHLLRQGRRPLLDHVIFCKLGSFAGPRFPLLGRAGSDSLGQEGLGQGPPRPAHSREGGRAAATPGLQIPAPPARPHPAPPAAGEALPRGAGLGVRGRPWSTCRRRGQGVSAKVPALSGGPARGRRVREREALGSAGGRSSSGRPSPPRAPRLLPRLEGGWGGAAGS